MYPIAGSFDFNNLISSDSFLLISAISLDSKIISFRSVKSRSSASVKSFSTSGLNHDPKYLREWPFTHQYPFQHISFRLEMLAYKLRNQMPC